VFDQEILATTDDTFTWGTPADVKFVRGDLAATGSYGFDQSGDVSATTSLSDSTIPPVNAGFYYLIRLAGSCTVGSWQSVIGAEPGRDQILP
jgi:hypothetical protein